jgi:hypothetical protein
MTTTTKATKRRTIDHKAALGLDDGDRQAIDFLDALARDSAALFAEARRLADQQAAAEAEAEERLTAAERKLIAAALADDDTRYALMRFLEERAEQGPPAVRRAAEAATEARAALEALREQDDSDGPWQGLHDLAHHYPHVAEAIGMEAPPRPEPPRLLQYVSTWRRLPGCEWMRLPNMPPVSDQEHAALIDALRHAGVPHALIGAALRRRRAWLDAEARAGRYVGGEAALLTGALGYLESWKE